MQKIDFDRQVAGFAMQLIGGMSALAPILIIASMLTAFWWVGMMDFYYFKDALPSVGLAVLAAVFLQMMRFGTALGGVRLFRSGRISGILFIAASVALTFFESRHVVTQAGALSFSSGGVEASKYLIQLALWSSLALEILVSVLVSGMYDEYKEGASGSATDADNDSGHTDIHTDNGRSCANCGTDISALRADAKYCGKDCRTSAWQAGNGRKLFFKKGK